MKWMLQNHKKKKIHKEKEQKYTEKEIKVLSEKENTYRDRLIETVVELAEDKKEELEIGVSAMEDNGFIVRALGHGGKSMYNFFLNVQDLLWESE